MAAPPVVSGLSSQDLFRDGNPKVLWEDEGIMLRALCVAMAEDLGDTPLKVAAIEHGLDPSLLSRYASLVNPATLPVLKLPRWTRIRGAAVLRVVVEAAGFELRRPAGEPGLDRGALAPAVARVASEAGKTLATCLEALADGVIDEDERQMIHATAGRLMLEIQAVHEATRGAK